MQKLLLAAAMAAGLAAPAFAQSAATDQTVYDPFSTGSVEVPDDPPSPVAPTAAAADREVPGSLNSGLGSEQSFEAGLGKPRDWTVSNPNNFNTPGG
ncbi:MAG TPA: hypothetical protein VMB73_16615 [Acetobacteraceae bacterium]|nr:hypothetical protein [Acetobacteraceae bacterium]